MPRRSADTSPVRFEVRVPPELHAELVAEAQADERSMNGEVVVLLREALAARRKRKR